MLRETCHQVLDDLGVHDPLLELAMELEDMALRDQYFIDKKLYPNVDFYSGIILKAMGFPTSMFTVLFAVARTVGWVAQWNEMITDPMQRIGRPRSSIPARPNVRSSICRSADTRFSVTAGRASRPWLLRRQLQNCLPRRAASAQVFGVIRRPPTRFSVRQHLRIAPANAGALARS